jgi:acetolactate synthase regulatory subunit
MRIHLTLELSTEPGALVRTLSTIERRGYSLVSVHSTASQEQHVSLEVETHDRAPDLIVRQLERLLTVVSVTSDRDSNDPNASRLR